MNPDLWQMIANWQPTVIKMANGAERHITRARLCLFAETLAVVDSGCWLWTGRLSPQGYGATKVQGVGIGVHRLAYLVFVGPIPAGFHVDHFCHTVAIERGNCEGGPSCAHRRCANPAHLRLATPRENTLTSLSWAAEHAQRTHCVNGHALEGANLYLRRGGGRACFQCHRDTDNRRRRELAEQEGRVVRPLPQDRTHCENGHPFDEIHTKVDKRGWRSCRTCANRRSREYRQRKKESGS
ncbi:HNH endonuclease signature motif containing protein [Streptomyces sp. NPDC059994]|uniref:HNH endonuclease signature motif containing protein n=1 Tax=Streptomyces sp. NPDC059994 TaxID=3347029 RepID=UPI0036BE794E